MSRKLRDGGRFDCPRCGAPLHAEPTKVTAHCAYCAEDVPVPWATDTHESKRGDSKPPPPPTGKGSGGTIAFAILGAAAIGGGIYLWKHHGSSLLNDIPVTISHDEAEDVEWDAQNDPPVITKMGNDEDFVGAFWTAGKGESRRDHSIYIGFFDGTSHEREWYAGPFGRVAQGKGATHFAFAQGHVLVSDYRGIVYGFDAITGKEQFSTKLPDRARSICTAVTPVWIDVVGDKGVTLDSKTGATTSAPARPPACLAPSTSSACETMRGRAECAGPDKAPLIPAFKPTRLLFDGDDGIGIGVSDATKPVPLVTGFSRASLSPRFKIALPADSVSNYLGIPSSVAEVAGGRAYVQYELKDSKWRLACIDVKTGERIWDVVVPGTKHGDEARSLVLSTSRLYLSHGDWLDIFDIKTGGALGEFGR
ncbi:hypothetical protein BH09MYX1_BH09MYX1_12610 [soil metagenome]